MYSFRVFAARRDRTGAKDHPPHIQPPSPAHWNGWGALGPGRLCSNLPGEQTRVVLVPMLPGCRTGNPGSTPGLSAHIKPSARAHQAEGAGCISPPAALAAVGLPGCRRAGGQSMKHSPSILQRGRLSRPCRRRSLSAAALRGRHGIRHPSCKPDWVRRARTGRQPAAAPLRAASGAAGIYITPLDVIPVAGSCQILNPRSVLPPQLCVGTSPSGQAANPVFCMPRSAIHQIQSRQASFFRARNLGPQIKCPPDIHAVLLSPDLPPFHPALGENPGIPCRTQRRPGTRADPGGRYAGTVFHPTHSPSPPCAWTDGKK